MTNTIEQTSTETPRRPASEIRMGRIKAAVWEHPSSNADGRPRRSVTVSKLYRTNQGQWKTTSGFDRDDLPVLIKVLDKVYEQLLSKPAVSTGGHDEQ